MTHQNILRISLLFTFLLMSLLGCSEPPLPAEQQILNNFESAKIALEQLEPKELREILAENFEIIGLHKQYDYGLIKKTMTVFRFRKQKINIILSGTTVTLDKYNTHLASLKSTALVTGGKGLLPEDGRLYKVNSQWRLYDNQWKITKLSWK
jgi:hypothetical protein